MEGSAIDIQKLLKDREADLNKVKAQIKQIEEEQTNLQRAKDQLLTRGIELQGRIKELQELSVLNKATEAVKA